MPPDFPAAVTSSPRGGTRASTIFQHANEDMDLNNYSTYFGTSMVVVAIIIVLALSINSAVTGALHGGPVEDGMSVVERIAPVGKVTTTEDKMPEPAAAPAAAPAAPTAAPAASAAARSGEAVYAATCQVCHVAGVANAPKMGDKAAWAPRIAKGIDALLASAVNGLNAMPPRGTCGDCSDAELKAAIEHMMAAAQ